MTTILLIDSDRNLCHMLCQAFEQEGYTTLVSHEGSQALELVQRAQPDLILLETQLLGLDGFSICRMIRVASAIPVMFLTSTTDESQRILGLDLGADDYVLKPFLLGELLARVRAHLRRTTQLVAEPQRTSLRCDDLLVDLGQHRVFRASREIALVTKEFDLLVCLMRNSGLVLSREALLQHVWGRESGQFSRTVDVHVRWLRTKIESDPSNPHFIRTVRGRGYRFTEGVLMSRTPSARSVGFGV